MISDSALKAFYSKSPTLKLIFIEKQKYLKIKQKKNT